MQAGCLAGVREGVELDSAHDGGLGMAVGEYSVNVKRGEFYR